MRIFIEVVKTSIEETRNVLERFKNEVIDISQSNKQEIVQTSCDTNITHKKAFENLISTAIEEFRDDCIDSHLGNPPVLKERMAFFPLCGGGDIGCFGVSKA